MAQTMPLEESVSSSSSKLSSLLTTLASRGFPLTGLKVRKLAYEYAQKKGKNWFSTGKGSAGYYWLKQFMQRHHLSLKTPEPLSVGRAAGMNRPVVCKWFDDLEKLLDELQIRDAAAHIWNCDESGLQEHFVQGRVVAETGSPCYQITCNEKAEPTTVLACFNAYGDYCPPTIIFKAKRLKPEWVIGAPPGSQVKVSDSGWITKEIFFEWAKAFVAFIPKTDNRPHMLLLDGHSSHIYNLQFLDLMKANNIHPYIFPPHTTHWLQPADKALFRSLKAHWTNQGIMAVNRSGGKSLGKGGFFSMFTPAWTAACVAETAQAGFRGCGIFPVNRNAVPANAYAPSETSERSEVCKQ